jgi:glycine betaine/choline ABC-type transport system substrate-binding protein
MIGATALIVVAIRFWTRSNKSEDETVEVVSEDVTESEIVKKMIEEERKKFL